MTFSRDCPAHGLLEPDHEPAAVRHPLHVGEVGQVGRATGFQEVRGFGSGLKGGGLLDGIELGAGHSVDRLPPCQCLSSHSQMAR
jgi:hypothetical protein